jgi:predicted secreted protein
MTTAAISGVGTKFRRWNSTSGAWEDISEINSITGPDMERETIDVTSLDSTGGYREFIASFRDGGTVELEMNFTRSGYELMKNDFESDTLQNYEIVIPDDDNTTLEFEGLVTALPLEITTDEKITTTVTIKISGQVSLESGSGPSPG